MRITPEAQTLVKIAQDILSEPEESEHHFLGHLTQAYFARHLLGMESNTIRLENGVIATTVFVADSSFLITLLAKGCAGHRLQWF